MSDREEPPPWLLGSAVADGDDPAAWWARAGDAVEALAVRYPRHLRHLPAGWWAEPAIAELLCALAAWRAMIDTGMVVGHPSVEFEFHRHLDHVRHVLDERHRAALAGREDDPWAPAGEPSGDDAGACRRAALEAALAEVSPLPETARGTFDEPYAGRPPARAGSPERG